MLEAAWWGFVGGVALLLGAGIGLVWRVPGRVIGAVMAFGAGVLISAVAFELVEEGFRNASAAPVVLGLLGGSVVFFVGDWVIDHRGGEHRKRSGGQQAGGSAGAIVAAVQSFAAGAILTMLADTMMPEGYEDGGSFVGLVTCAGFIAAFLLSQA